MSVLFLFSLLALQSLARDISLGKQHHDNLTVPPFFHALLEEAGTHNSTDENCLLDVVLVLDGLGGCNIVRGEVNLATIMFHNEALLVNMNGEYVVAILTKPYFTIFDAQTRNQPLQKLDLMGGTEKRFEFVAGTDQNNTLSKGKNCRGDCFDGLCKVLVCLSLVNGSAAIMSCKSTMF